MKMSLIKKKNPIEKQYKARNLMAEQASNL